MKGKAYVRDTCPLGHSSCRLHVDVVQQLDVLIEQLISPEDKSVLMEAKREILAHRKVWNSFAPCFKPIKETLFKSGCLGNWIKSNDDFFRSIFLPAEWYKPTLTQRDTCIWRDSCLNKNCSCGIPKGVDCTWEDEPSCENIRGSKTTGHHCPLFRPCPDYEEESFAIPQDGRRGHAGVLLTPETTIATT